MIRILLMRLAQGNVQIGPLLSKLGVQTNPSAEWGWAIARIAVVAATAVGANLFLRGVLRTPS